MMKKRVVDLTSAELEQFADQAWSAAAQDALAQGFPIVGSRDGQLLRYHSDGRIEVIGTSNGGPEQEAVVLVTGTRTPQTDTADGLKPGLDPSAIGKPRAT
jgi:hypothetical protein